MDFHSLARRDLQFLCKKNRIPANLTNVAMAKALEALETVEGIEEIQEALGFQFPKVNSPQLPHTGLRTFTRGVTHGDEPKIEEMASKEEEIQENLGFQSLYVKSPQLPRTVRRTSAVRAAHREEEGEKKETPQILPKTPATRKAAKGAQSSRRRASKNEDVEGHTETPKVVEAKGGKAIGVVTRRSTRLSSRKALEESVTTQSQSRSSSRESLAVKMEALAKEDIAEQEKEKEKKDLINYGDSGAVIVEEHEKKDLEEESCEFSSSNEVDAHGEVENEFEATHEDVHEIQQQQPRLRSRSHRVNTKALEATKMVSKEEEDKKVPMLSPNSRRSTRLSSRKPAEEESREEGTVKIGALTVEKEMEQEKEEENTDLAEKSGSCVVVPVEEDEEKDKKEESHGYSSLKDFENGDSIAALVEVEENNQDLESHGFSSSTHAEDSNIEVESGESTIVLVEGDEKNEELEIQVFSSSIEMQNSDVKLKNEVESDDSTIVLVEGEEKNEELEIQVFSLSNEMQNSDVKLKNDVSNVIHAEEERRNDQEESHDLSSLLGENSIVELYEPFEFKEESGDQPPANENVKDSSYQSPESEHVGVSCNHSSENDLVQDSSHLVPTNEAVEDSVHHSSDAKLASSVLSDKLLCSEVPPLPHEEVIQKSSGIEEEERKLSLLFSEMTLKEAEECGDANLVITANVGFPQDDCSSQDLIPLLISENVDALTNLDDEASTIEAIGETPEEFNESGGVISSKISVSIGKSIDDDLSDAGSVQGVSFESQILISSIEFCTEVSAADSIIELPAKVKKSGGDLLRDPVIIKESSEDSITGSSELNANGFVDALKKEENCFFELKIPVSSSELCSEFLAVDSTIESDRNHGESVEDFLNKLVANDSFDVLPKTEIYQVGSFELQNPVSCTEPYFELSIVDSAIDSKEYFGDLPSEFSALIDESGLPNSDKISSEKSVDAETSQGSTFEPQLPVLPATAELCVEFSATSLATISSPLKLPCESEARSLLKPSIVQTQASEKAAMAATETAEEKEETKTKASEKEVFLKDENLELLSLTKLRAMYKQMLNGPKTEERKKSIIKQEELACLSGINDDENNKQKLNDDITKSESKRSVIKQEDFERLSRSKLDSNCKQKLNDDKIKSERKRTPLKNLNYSTF